MAFSFRHRHCSDFKKVMVVSEEDRLTVRGIMKLSSVCRASHLLFQSGERVNTTPLQSLRNTHVDVFIYVDL